MSKNLSAMVAIDLNASMRNLKRVGQSKSVRVGIVTLPMAKEEVRKSPVEPLDLKMTVERPPLATGTANTDQIIVIALIGEGPPLKGLINGVGFKH
ncbi:hypothetical protein Ancab_014510 [Ancistrocladus abbreviatus]